LSQHEIPYAAREFYEDPSVVESYERVRFGGVLGRYRYRREQHGVAANIAALPTGVEILDLPCGIGRWWPLLGTKAARIVARDISSAMVERARTNAANATIPIDVSTGDAEHIDLPDGAIDFVFSHALTKHLPIPVQHRVLKEFARVARRGIVCSFSVVTGPKYEIWRRRGLVESFPLLPEQLDWLIGDIGMELVAANSCTTPLGIEQSVLMLRRDIQTPSAS
jgi:SAM-dependent methyltransferase